MVYGGYEKGWPAGDAGKRHLRGVRVSLKRSLLEVWVQVWVRSLDASVGGLAAMRIDQEHYGRA
ncbi:hypothetical protein IEQ34_002637 [Dendrobium chrysotoxum]|uniref:Uncharacterized protein n=1 Tax=Dendrobium chrysotoxum TaxID=161865 RepID=A0AAV7HHJ0_DENCH|nr:hypothetical protein IEQ34_002637 [Dendrobium chrysotoxum]